MPSHAHYTPMVWEFQREGREAVQVTWLWEIPKGAESALLNAFVFLFSFFVFFVVALCFFKQHKWD